MTIAKKINVSLRLLCITALASAAAGCVGEDMSGCPPPGPNVKIAFTLLDEGSLTDEIESVIAVLFDGRGNYIPPATTLDKAALDKYAGVELKLDPGDYRMVFWANVGENTEIRVIDGTPVLTYKDFNGTSRQVLGNGDPVWYAPAVRTTRVDADARPLRYYEFTVTAGGDHTDEVAFTETHNTVNVYIGGLQLDAASMPTVEITNLTSAVDFWGMQPLDDPLPTVTSAVRTVAVVRDNVSYAMAAFELPPLGDMTGMSLVVRDATGNVIFSIALADAVTQSGADPTSHGINQLLNFGDVNVTVEVWDWDDNELDKEW